MNRFNWLILFTAFAFLIPNLVSGQEKKQKPSKKDYVVTLSTNFGNIYLVLYDETPKHKANFLKLVEEKFYDSTTFHRVIKDFMIQGGDPLTKPGGDISKGGTGGPGYTVDAEFVKKFKHKKGALAAARQGDRVNPKKASSGSQFYIVQNKKGTPHLNGGYTVFGEVIKGLDVVDKIAEQEVERRSNRPMKHIRMAMTAKLMKKKKITEEFGHEYPEMMKKKKKVKKVKEN